MTDNNPFDLEGRDGGPARAHPAKVWTAEDQAEKLSGYLEVSPEFWEHIRYGTHIRYLTKANEFRSGGFILKNPFDTTPKGNTSEKRFMKLQNGFNDKSKGYQQWIAAYEDVAKVWMKPDAGVLMMLRNLDASVQKLNDNIRKIAIFTKNLDRRLERLEALEKR